MYLNISNVSSLDTIYPTVNPLLKRSTAIIGLRGAIAVEDI